MRRALLVLAWGVIALLVQGTLLHGVFPGLIAPGLLVVIVVFLSFHEPTVWGALGAFLLGILFDLGGGIVIGPWAGSFAFVFGFISVLSQRIFIESPFATLVTAFAASVASNLIYTLLVFQVARSHALSAQNLLIEAGLTALVCPLLFGVMKRAYIKSDRASSHRARYLR